MARTERESDRRRREEKWQTCWCCRDQQSACSMAQASAEKFKHTGPGEKERVASLPQREQLANTPEPPLPKRKGTEPLSRVTIHEGERVKVGESRTLGNRGGSEWEHEEERVDSTVKEGKFQGGEGGQTRKASLEEVEGSMSG